MKKLFAFISLLTISLVFVIGSFQSGSSQAADRPSIPDDAIRLRILANSDSPADQAVKRQVRDAVNADITGWVRDLKSPAQAESVIRSHMLELRQTVKETLRKVHADESFTMKLGKADFPTKMYGDDVYPAGKYNALVITLGDGKGANWWCVLFPPLCFLDFSNGEAVRADQPAASSHSGSDRQSRVSGEAKTGRDAAEKAPKTSGVSDSQPESVSGEKTPNEQEDVEVRSFIGDFLSNIWNAIFG
ncbi:stage II sporulation protein R [Sporolactobacillus sp. THM7-7]|nr:stage II sporulation protein R [Sporolactobacillus sp. THM7-7]